MYRLVMPGEGGRFPSWGQLSDTTPLAEHATYEIALEGKRFGIFSLGAIGNSRRKIENQSEGRGARIAGKLYKPGDESNPLLESHGIETIFS